MLARQKAQRQLQRRAARTRRRRAVATATGSALGVVAVVALGVLAVTQWHPFGLGRPAASPTPSAVAPTTALCTYTRPPAGQGGTVARKVSPPAVNGIPRAGSAVVDLTTNRGLIQLTLDQAKAPCTTHSFVSLVQQKYFDNTPCHRLTTQGLYVLQCGDPSGTGSGGPGYVFPDENLPKAASGGNAVYPRGTVAMANSGPGTNGSQFFLVYKDSPLPPNYSIFGTVTQGLSVIDAIAKGGTDKPGDGKPKLAVTIEKATLLSGGGSSPAPAASLPGSPGPGTAPSAASSPGATSRTTRTPAPLPTTSVTP